MSNEETRPQLKDLSLFVPGSLAAASAGHLLFLAGTDAGNHTTIASLGPLWVVFFFAPCLGLGYFARRFALLQSIAFCLIAACVVERLDYVPYFRSSLIPQHPSREYLVTSAAWIVLAALLGAAGALLKRALNKSKSNT